MKMKQALLATVILAGLLGMTTGATAAEGSGSKPQAKAQASNKQSLCPIDGKAIDTNAYVDYQGWRVYLCCEDCAAKFKADPAKYLKKLAEDGIVLEPAPARSAPRYEGSGTK